MILLTFWNWVTLLTNFHKRANGIIEHYLRLLLPIPFWVIFLIYSINFLSPINFYPSDNNVKKEIIIDNNTNSELNVKFIGVKYKTGYYLTNSFDNYLSEIFTLSKNEKRTILFDIDTSIIKTIMVTKVDNSDLIFQYSKGFKVNNTKLLLFGDEFEKSPVKAIKIRTGYYYKLILIYTLAIFASWYYYFWAFMKKNKKIFLILSIITSTISIAGLFFSIRFLL
jgi:hypothetical protein